MTTEPSIEVSLLPNQFTQLLRIFCLDEIGSWVGTEEFGVRDWDCSLDERLAKIAKHHGLSNYIRECDEKTYLGIEDEGFQKIQEAWGERRQRHTYIDLAWEFATRDLKARGMVLKEFEGDIESNPDFGYALQLQIDLTDAYVKEFVENGLSGIHHGFGKELADSIEAEVAASEESDIPQRPTLKEKENDVT
jgi:hypothetical protein